MSALAIIADSHLPRCANSAQEAALRWAARVCRDRTATAVLGLGDLTAVGDPPTARRVKGIVDLAGCPTVHTAGNAEMRTPGSAAAVRDMLTTPTPIDINGAVLVAIDTADACIEDGEKRRIGGCLAGLRNVVIMTHCPPQALPAADRLWLESFCRDGHVGVILAGHKHFDAYSELAGVPVHLFRGLDPDKAKHGPPAMALLHRNTDGWLREDIPFAGADPRHWPPAVKMEFGDLLGVSTMTHTVPDLVEAIEAGIRCIELRAACVPQEIHAQVRDLLGVWRRNGGRTLSIHLPSLRWDVDAQRPAGARSVAVGTQLALGLGADRVTVHVPDVSTGAMAPGLPAREALTRVTVDALEPLRRAGITIGVENMHMRAGEPADDRRGFGYLPTECLDWVRLLREHLGTSGVGLHLDLGHARNNAPFSSEWTLGRWYAEVGRDIVGYHLHQVNGNGNHQPMHTPFGPLLSLGSFLWAWHGGQLSRAPMFLEIRGEPGRVSRDSLCAFVEQPPPSPAGTGTH